MNEGGTFHMQAAAGGGTSACADRGLEKQKGGMRLKCVCLRLWV